MLLYHFRDSQYKDETVSRRSYLYDGNPIHDNTLFILRRTPVAIVVTKGSDISVARRFFLKIGIRNGAHFVIPKFCLSSTLMWLYWNKGF